MTTIGKEGLSTARRIAQRDGIDVSEAVSSTEFDLWTKANEEDKRRKASELSKSKGGKQRTVKSLDTPGLTRDEHKALAERASKG